MSEQYFLVNKLVGELILRQGYLVIPSKGYTKIGRHEANDPTVIYAIERNLAEIVTEEPQVESETSGIIFTVTEPYTGMTEAELLASKKQQAQEPVAEPAVTTALGQSTEVSTEGATGTPIGQDTTVELKPEPKAKKKAA